MLTGVTMSPQIRRQTLLFVAFDLGVVGGIMTVWYWLELLPLGLGIGVSLLRIAAWLFDLRRRLQPIDSWLRCPVEQRTQQLTLDADESMQRLAAGFGRSYTAAWLGCYVFWIGGAILSHRAGAAEAVCLGMMTVAITISLPTIVRPMFFALTDVALELSTDIDRRGLGHRRRPTSLTHTSLGISILLVSAALLGVAATGKYGQVRSIRDATVVEQQLRVELSVARMAVGGEALPGISIVDELPAGLDIEPGSPAAARYDKTRELVVAAAALGDGRHAYVEVAPDEDLVAFVRDAAALVLFVIPVLYLVGWAHGRSIAAPLERFDAAVVGFLDGHMLTLDRISPLRADELGRLAASFNRMLDLLADLTRAAEAVAEGKLDVEIAHHGELPDAFRAMVDQLHAMVVRIRETALELASASAEIQAITQQHERASTEQAATVQQVSHSVGSLAQAAEQISHSAAEVLVNAEQTRDTADTIVQRIAELDEQTERIGELLEQIREIAQRSDLLALNGSLEATRAGEAGRGFALVSAEMRRLAERVAGVVADVRTRVGDIEAAGDGAVLASASGRSLAQQTTDAAQTITRVTDAQRQDTQQAAVAVKAVADMVVAGAAATSQTLAAANGLREYAAELERLTGAFELRDDDSAP